MLVVCVQSTLYKQIEPEFVIDDTPSLPRTCWITREPALPEALLNTIIPLFDQLDTDVTVKGVPTSVALDIPMYMLPVFRNVPIVAIS